MGDGVQIEASMSKDYVLVCEKSIWLLGKKMRYSCVGGAAKQFERVSRYLVDLSKKVKNMI